MDTRPTADTPDRGLAVAGPSQRGIEWVPNYFNTLTPPPRPAPIGDSVEWPISDIRPPRVLVSEGNVGQRLPCSSDARPPSASQPAGAPRFRGRRIRPG